MLFDSVYKWANYLYSFSTFIIDFCMKFDAN